MAELDGRQGTFCGQRQCGRDVPFKSPCKMAYHGSSENGLNWTDAHIEYKEFHTVLTEALACFTHIYAYGLSKCTFLPRLTGRPYHKLEDLECPTRLFQSQTLVYIAMPQVSHIPLRNQNHAFPLRLVDTLSAKERICPMPC